MSKRYLDAKKIIKANYNLDKKQLFTYLSEMGYSKDAYNDPEFAAIVKEARRIVDARKKEKKIQESKNNSNNTITTLNFDSNNVANSGISFEEWLKEFNKVNSLESFIKDMNKN